MKLQQHNVLAWLCMACLSQNLYATSITMPYPTVITFNLGPGWPTSSQNEVIELLPQVNNRYISSSNTDAFIDGELFLGWQEKINQCKYLDASQIGIAYMVTNSAKIKGVIWQANNPLFDNEIYSYRIKHSHVALRGKLLSVPKDSYQGYFTGSVGVAFNTSYAFNAFPVISTVLRSSGFQTNTETGFTYTLGAGVQKKLNKNWAIGMGYQFADWGKSRLNRAPGQTMNSGIGFQNFYTQEAQFNLTYSLK